MRTAFANLEPNYTTSDRFIPLRSSLNDGTGFLKNDQNSSSIISQVIPDKQRVLNFKKNHQPSIINQNNEQVIRQKKKFNFPKKPIKVLDAPGLLDDYYLNLVCWGKTNLIAVGLEDSVYFFNFLNNGVKKHIYLPQIYSNDYFNPDLDFQPYICSLSFNDTGNNMAISDSNGQILITDVQKNKIVSNELVNNSRIGSLHWQDNLLVSGSRDKIIRLFDVRQKFCKPVYSFAGHMQEICGLKFSPDNKFIASGGNDNQLLLWDMRKMKLFSCLGDHEAAVKALTWNPKYNNILVSGAGTSDRNLRIFDVNQSKELVKQDTGSQVCNVTFDQEGKVLLSTHGYSLNQLIVWDTGKNFTSLNKEELLIAHKLRVLYLANSPCGKYVVTGAGDETLRIWNVFQGQSMSNKNSFKSSILGMR